MKLYLEYFGIFVLAFVLLVAGFILLKGTPMPETSLGELIGMVLGLVAIGGSFAWYYLGRSHMGPEESSSLQE